MEKLKMFIFEDLLSIGKSEDFQNEDNLFQLGLDSMRMMRLIHFIEEEFNITIPAVEVIPANIYSMESLEKLITRYV